MQEEVSNTVEAVEEALTVESLTQAVEDSNLGDVEKSLLKAAIQAAGDNQEASKLFGMILPPKQLSNSTNPMSLPGLLGSDRHSRSRLCKYAELRWYLLAQHQTFSQTFHSPLLNFGGASLWSEIQMF